VPEHHPLAGKARVSLRRLAEEMFVDFPAGSPGRAQSDQAFGAAQLVRDVAFDVTALDLMLRIVRQGLAIALLPSAVAGGASRLAIVPVTNGPRRVEYLIWSKFNPTPATSAFLHTLQLT
jgi:DNA-binding transcriptional LysR family regulator